MNKYSKTEKAMPKRNYLILFIAALVLLVGIVTIQAGNKNLQSTVTENEMLDETAESGKKLTVWNIIKMTDWLFWPFTIITAVGIMLIIYFTLLEHQEKSRSRRLMQSEIKPNDIRSVLQVIRGGESSRASRLLNQMIATFNKTNHAETISNDVNQFVSGERESFETFNRVTTFLSDSAGALGLLGTVWGIFQTFHAGKLDGPTILQGMSISLVTTLVGLIISLLLNMGSTYVFTLFNEQLKAISAKGEELRQALLFLEKRTNGRYQTEAAPQKSKDIRVVKPQPAPKRKKRVQDRVEVAF